MADILLDLQGAPATPSAGKAVIYLDTTVPTLVIKDASGRYSAQTNNASTASTAAGFASDTYVTDSDIMIPGFGLQTKAVVRWTISASKTAAGVATPAYAIRIGSTRTTSDTARLTLTGPAQTAIADIGTLWITTTVRTIGASGVLQGTAWWNHRGTAANTTTSGTGFANDTTGHIEGTSAGFDMTSLAGQYIGLSINGGASAAWTLTQVQVLAFW